MIESEKKESEEDMQECNLLIPRFETKFEKEEGECLLPLGHRGYHLNKLSDGNYLSWGGNGCDEYCDWCGECFNYEKISEGQAKTILADPSKNKDD